MIDSIELRCPSFKSEDNAKAYDRRAVRILKTHRGINRIGFMQYRLQYRPRGFRTFDRVFRDIDQALEVQAQLKAMYKSGTLEATEHATGTLDDLLRRYAKEAVPKISSYPGRVQSRLIKLCQYEITKIKVHKLTRQHFNAFRDERRAETRMVRGKEKHISRKTIKDEVSLMRRVLEYAEDEWAINLPKGNPIDVRRIMKHIPNDTVKKKAIRNTDVEEQLLKACAEYGDGHSLRNLVELGLATGCRRGELVALRWENIYLDERIMQVRNKDRRNDGNPYRRVPLGKRAIGVLNRIGVISDGDVFIYANPDSVTKALSRVRDRNKNIPDFEIITPHTLRHTAVTRAQQKGLSPAQVQAMTGHKTTQMLDNYTHLRAEDVVDLIE